jgi:peroxiredoxin
LNGRTARARRRAAAASAPAKGKAAKAAARQRPVQAPKHRGEPTNQRLRLAAWALFAVAAAVVGLYALTQFGQGGSASSTGGSASSTGGGASNTGGDAAYRGSSEYPYAVGSPAPGELAPPIKLPSTAGETFGLAAYKGKEPVLLYFQEGLMCQPCWDQIVAIERELPKFRALGAANLVSITGDPLNLLEQKVSDEGIETRVLSDEGYAVSDSYDARSYGMMSGQMAGHSFILVGKDGKIVWRADYGGEPNYTMFVPVPVLLRDLEQGVKPAR